MVDFTAFLSLGRCGGGLLASFCSTLVNGVGRSIVLSHSGLVLTGQDMSRASREASYQDKLKSQAWILEVADRCRSVLGHVLDVQMLCGTDHG
jgi:hypothetical protein